MTPSFAGMAKGGSDVRYVLSLGHGALAVGT